MEFRILFPCAGVVLLAACAANAPMVSKNIDDPANPAAAETPRFDGSHLRFVAAAAVPASTASAATAPATTQAASYYTCIMHPAVHVDGPGNCPFCGMVLIKKDVTPSSQKGAAK